MINRILSSGCVRFSLAVVVSSLSLRGAQPVAPTDKVTPSNSEYPHPVKNPNSSVMLKGDWVPKDTHQIDFERLPRIPTQHVVVVDVRNKGWTETSKVNTEKGGEAQHNYLVHHDGAFWVMWSEGPGIEARVGCLVRYATSSDGLNWSEPRFLTGFPPNSGPDSPHYNTRTLKGMRYMARGFWVREGKLLALVSLDESAGFFGPSLQLLAWAWDPTKRRWDAAGVVQKNAINNFPPQKLPTGEWGVSQRTFDYMKTGSRFLIGGVKALDQWESVPVVHGDDVLKPEEPHWWTLPDGNLAAFFRDNAASHYVFRSFSTDSGRTWSKPVKTNFPDARSKFYGLRLSDGRYAFVSNPKPGIRDVMTVSLSDDGMVFNKMFYLVGGRTIDYPHMMEHNGFLYITHNNGKRGVEVHRVRIRDLNTLEMPARLSR